MDSIFEAFGHSRTLRSRSAARFCKYVEFQYGHDRQLVGIGTVSYQLDTSRFTSAVALKEESFPVFYCLLAGCTLDERRRWHLGDSASFRFLHGSPFFHTQESDGRMFLELQKALKHLKIGFRLQKQIWQVLAAILHLGMPS